VFVFAAYALVDGVFALVSAVRTHADGPPWWFLALEGVTGIAVGMSALVLPGFTAFALLYLIAAWALATGVLEIAVALRLRRSISGEWLLAVGGVLSMALGLLLILFPGPGALAVVLWIGAYALIFGVLFVALGLRLRALRSSSGEHVHYVGPGGP